MLLVSARLVSIQGHCNLIGDVGGSKVWRRLPRLKHSPQANIDLTLRSHDSEARSKRAGSQFKIDNIDTKHLKFLARRDCTGPDLRYRIKTAQTSKTIRSQFKVDDVDEIHPGFSDSMGFPSLEYAKTVRFN